MVFQCNRCGNKDLAFFYKGTNGYYCRKCVRFISSSIKEENIKVVDSEYKLKFDLTERQKYISDNLTQYVNAGKSVLLEAVCGAGKTELVYKCISQQLDLGHKVGFAIARRQVVLEICERLASVFTKLKVVAVCQGYTDDVIGDLIVCTTHQLYRYNHYFDLLIIDEPDAFPYKGNMILQGFAKNSCKGSFVYLTATPDEKLKTLVSNGQLEYLYLSKRPTGKQLCVPKVYYNYRYVLNLIGLVKLKELLDLNKPVIVFAPTIKIGKGIYKFLSLFVSCCNIDSTVKNKDELIKDFRNGKYKLCVSTTVLERGITIPSVNIIVYLANNMKFDEASLTQMAGRVGRSMSDPWGICYFLATGRSVTIDKCINSIRKANDD